MTRRLALYLLYHTTVIKNKFYVKNSLQNVANFLFFFKLIFSIINSFPNFWNCRKIAKMYGLFRYKLHKIIIMLLYIISQACV